MLWIPKLVQNWSVSDPKIGGVPSEPLLIKGFIGVGSVFGQFSGAYAFALFATPVGDQNCDTGGAVILIFEKQPGRDCLPLHANALRLRLGARSHCHVWLKLSLITPARSVSSLWLGPM